MTYPDDQSINPLNALGVSSDFLPRPTPRDIEKWFLKARIVARLTCALCGSNANNFSVSGRAAAFAWFSEACATFVRSVYHSAVRAIGLSSVEARATPTAPLLPPT